GAHQVAAGAALVGQHLRAQRRRLGEGDVDAPPPVGALVLQRRAAPFRGGAAPAPPHPAHHHGPVPPPPPEVPDPPAPPAPHQRPPPPPQGPLGEYHHAPALAQRLHRRPQFGGLPAVARRLHPDGPDDVGHQPAERRPVVEDAGHHRREEPGHDDPQPGRVGV